MNKLVRAAAAVSVLMLMAACAGMEPGEFGISSYEGSPYQSPFGFDDGAPSPFFGAGPGWGWYDGGLPEADWDGPWDDD